MRLISLLTVKISKLFSRKDKVKSPTLHEVAKVDDGGKGVNANLFGSPLSPQLKMWCLEKAAKMCEQGSFYKKQDGIIHCYENNPQSIEIAYKSLIGIVASL